jgi:hypothetical protein
MAGEVTLIIDGAVMEEVLRGPDGPVMRYLIQGGDRVIAGARDQIETKRSRWTVNKKSGRLGMSIVKRFSTSDVGPVMSIVAGAGLDPSYAYWVHEGNGPPGSRIFPKRARFLAFVTSGERPTDPAGWAAARASGRAVITPSVATSKPNRYLSDNLYLMFV